MQRMDSPARAAVCWWSVRLTSLCSIPIFDLCEVARQKGTPLEPVRLDGFESDVRPQDGGTAGRWRPPEDCNLLGRRRTVQIDWRQHCISSSDSNPYSGPFHRWAVESEAGFASGLGMRIALRRRGRVRVRMTRTRWRMARAMERSAGWWNVQEIIPRACRAGVRMVLTLRRLAVERRVSARHANTV